MLSISLTLLLITSPKGFGWPLFLVTHIIWCLHTFSLRTSYDVYTLSRYAHHMMFTHFLVTHIIWCLHTFSLRTSYDVYTLSRYAHHMMFTHFLVTHIIWYLRTSHFLVTHIIWCLHTFSLRTSHDVYTMSWKWPELQNKCREIMARTENKCSKLLKINVRVKNMSTSLMAILA